MGDRAVAEGRPFRAAGDDADAPRHGKIRRERQDRRVDRSRQRERLRRLEAELRRRPEDHLASPERGASALRQGLEQLVERRIGHSFRFLKPGSPARLSLAGLSGAQAIEASRASGHRRRDRVVRSLVRRRDGAAVEPVERRRAFDEVPVLAGVAAVGDPLGARNRKRHGSAETPKAVSGRARNGRPGPGPRSGPGRRRRTSSARTRRRARASRITPAFVFPRRACRRGPDRDERRRPSATAYAIPT